MSEDLIKKLTGKNRGDYERVASLLVNKADVELFKELEDREYVFPAAALNEFIMKIESFPYKYVSPIMEVINREDCFLKYFEVISNKLQ